MHWTLLTVAAIASTYFLLKKRRVDFMLVGYVSSLIYFLPGLVGYTLSPTTPGNRIKLPIEIVPTAYAVMTIVLLSIFIGTIIYDSFLVRRNSSQLLLLRLEAPVYASHVAMMMALVGFFASWLTSGGAIFAPDKVVVMENVGRGHVLWEMGSSFAVLFALDQGRRIPLAVGLMLIVLDMYIGFRFAFAMTFIAMLVLQLSKRSASRLYDIRARFWLLALAGGIFIISYQNLKAPLRAGDWNEIGTRMSSLTWWGGGILTSEPFTTQTILNEIVRRDFATGTEHLWSAFDELILFSPQLGAETVRFGDIFQPAIFPLVDHGLANNIWAQMWSAGGWPLLGAFVLVYVGMLMLGSLLLGTVEPAVRVFAVLFFSYWAFYIHRNELLVQVGFQKQVTIVGLSAIVLSVLIQGAMSRRHGVAAPATHVGAD